MIGRQFGGWRRHLLLQGELLLLQGMHMYLKVLGFLAMVIAEVRAQPQFVAQELRQPVGFSEFEVRRADFRRWRPAVLQLLDLLLARQQLGL
eukprot:6185957-Pleurochrysis_carterae.AAC.2